MTAPTPRDIPILFSDIPRSGVQVVKVERAFRPGGWIMITDKDGHVHTQPLLGYVDAAMGADQVAYFHGAWSSIVGWGLSDRVEDPGW